MANLAKGVKARETIEEYPSASTHHGPRRGQADRTLEGRIEGHGGQKWPETGGVSGIQLEADDAGIHRRATALGLRVKEQHGFGADLEPAPGREEGAGPTEVPGDRKTLGTSAGVDTNGDREVPPTSTALRLAVRNARCMQRVSSGPTAPRSVALAKASLT